MASKSFGGTVKLTGESEYQQALRGITDNLKVLNSELKVVTSQYDKNDTSTSNLAQQNEVLNKKIAEQQEKVNILANALSDAEEETGKNSTTSQKWRVELNNAQAELNKLVKNVDDNEKTMKDSASATEENTEAIDKFGKEAEEGGNSALKLGDMIKANLISEGIIAGVKALGSALSAVGSAFIDIGKQAIQSYANYEQLVGGVETLFGARGAKTVEEYAQLVGKTVDEVEGEFASLMVAQGQVLDNANKAYVTSGMSANEYMETVTSFSASLIQSLDGDTVKASEVANQAIIDMSDNANKMGTDIEMIQNAYQGFAKQNYTMLDNLKLGYGGTKGEMARLLEEANKLDASIVTAGEGGMESFANIAQAIHVIQTEMGITGTTVDEAGRTISGSTGSMKAAWENLVTGIADDNANFEVLVDNLVTSIVGDGSEENKGFFGNMLPRIQTALDGIVQMVVSLTDTLLPQIVVIGTELITNLVNSINENMPALLESASTILNTLINGIVDLLPALLPVALSLITTLVDALLENLPTIIDAGITLLVSLAQGITSELPYLIPVAIDAILNLVDTLLDNIDLVIDAGIDLIIALTEGLIYAIPKIIEKAPVIITKFTNAITDNFPKIVTMAGELMGKLASGLLGAIPSLVNAIPQIITSLKNGFDNSVSNIKNIGKNLVEGIVSGVLTSMDWLKSQFTSWVGNVTKFIKSLFGIKSPSRLFKDEIGTNLALGIGEGFTDTMSDVTTDMQDALPTEFDTSVSVNGSSSSYGSNYDYLVTAFKEALKEVKVVMNNREMGTFIVNTVQREVYA